MFPSSLSWVAMNKWKIVQYVEETSPSVFVYFACICNEKHWSGVELYTQTQ